MANGGLFIGWGELVAGREHQATQVFGEFVGHFTELQQRGEIESIEPFGLEAHGGDLGGFFLIRGDRDRLNGLRHTDEFYRLVQRAGVVVHNFGVVSVYLAEEIGRLVSSFQENTSDLTGAS